MGHFLGCKQQAYYPQTGHWICQDLIGASTNYHLLLLTQQIRPNQNVLHHIYSYQPRNSLISSSVLIGLS